jgi:hypothetical protein
MQSEFWQLYEEKWMCEDSCQPSLIPGDATTRLNRVPEKKNEAQSVALGGYQLIREDDRELSDSSEGPGYEVLTVRCEQECHSI